MRISGKKIFLRPLHIDDVYGNWWKWFNDKEVTRYMNKGNEKNTPEKQRLFFEKVNRSKYHRVFAICEKLNGVHIGTVGLHDIDVEKKIAQFGIIIGEKNFWKKGIGKEAWSLVIRHGFCDLNLEDISTKIFKKNKASIKIAERLGFSRNNNDEKIIKNGIPEQRINLILKKELWLKSNISDL